MRCKHLHVEIIELATASSWHQREAPGRWVHDNSAGNYTGVVLVECRACGFGRRYTPSNRPAWVQAALNEAISEKDGDA